MQDPQSLHKYLYVHGDPINWIDPTGKTLSASFSVSGMVAAAIIVTNVLFVWGPELLWGIRALTGTRRDSAGIGGRDITPHLRNIQSEYMSQWQGRTDMVKQAILSSLNDIWPDGLRLNAEDYNALYGWDIHPLAWDKGSFGEERVNIPETVTVDGNVYFPEEVNYFLIGLVYRMAYEDGDAGYRFENLDLKIRFYRHVSRFFETGTGHIEGRVAWAKAGWRAGSGNSIQFPSSDSVRLRNARANPTEHPQSLWTHVGESYGPPNHRIDFMAR